MGAQGPKEFNERMEHFILEQTGLARDTILS
jgi:hypothetical protein